MIQFLGNLESENLPDEVMNLWILTIWLTSSGCRPHMSSVWPWSGAPKVHLYNTFLGGLRQTHTTVPKLMHAYQIYKLLGKSWLKSSRISSWQRVRLLQSGLTPWVILSKKRLGARLVESLRRVAVRSFASVAKPMAVPTRPTTPWTAVAMKQW